MQPHIHAESSAKIFGGKPEDYMEIHNLLDSSKKAFPNMLHRSLTHHGWFIREILPRIFGNTIVNSDGNKVSVIEIGERHVLEDFGGKFIPSAEDYLRGAPFKDWMDNGKNGFPESHKMLLEFQKGLPNVNELELIHTSLEQLQEDEGHLFALERRPCGPPGAFD